MKGNAACKAVPESHLFEISLMNPVLEGRARTTQERHVLKVWSDLSRLSLSIQIVVSYKGTKPHL